MKKAKFYMLAIWLCVFLTLGTAWATISSSNSVSITAGPALATIATGTPAPSWSPIADTVGTVTAGNLYNISAADTGRFMIRLILTDSDELAQAYSYFNLNITIYATGSTYNVDTGTKKASEWLVTMSSGGVVFYVSGSQYYVVRVDDGAYYCTSTSNSDNLSPEFYLMVDDA
jgi:hypothetical protein